MTVYEEIQAERAYQDKKWGHEIDDTKNTPWTWSSYIGQYSTKWMVGTFPPLSKFVDDFRSKMIKVAAIAVAAVESIDRQRANSSKAFFE